jgi:hypothetical protein
LVECSSSEIQSFCAVPVKLDTLLYLSIEIADALDISRKE